MLSSQLRPHTLLTHHCILPLTAAPSGIIPALYTLPSALVTLISSAITPARLAIGETPEASLALIAVLAVYIGQTQALACRDVTVVVTGTYVTTVTC